MKKIVFATALMLSGYLGNAVELNNNKTNKMKVEIWSDVMCPFCYIGKRNFETALNQFPHKDQIDIVWKSFQLDPDLPTTPLPDYDEYLANRKGFSKDQVKGMLANVTKMAKDVGLDYHLDKAVIVNSFSAHQLLQFASSKGKGNEMEERIFKAYFTEGKNVGDQQILISLGKEIGLDEKEMKDAFNDQKYSQAVNNDIKEASEIGVTGVPFFVIDRKYAISGAQPPNSFLQGITKAFEEWQKNNPTTLQNLSEGATCDPKGNCD